MYMTDISFTTETKFEVLKKLKKHYPRVDWHFETFDHDLGAYQAICVSDKYIAIAEKAEREFNM